MKNCNPGTLGIPIFGSCIVFDSIPNLDLTVQGPLWSEPPCSRTSIPPYGWQADGLHPNGLLSCYRPQRSWGKVIFSQASVILFTGGGGSASVHVGIPPPPDQAGTPPRGPGRHPPGAEHTGRYGQRAGGMHPTGMQSCFIDYFIVLHALPLALRLPKNNTAHVI